MTHRWGDGFRVIHKRNVYIKPVNIYGKGPNKNGFFHPHHGINWTTNIDIFGRNGPARKGDASVRSENIDAWLLNANLSVASLNMPIGSALQRIWNIIFGYFNTGQKIGAGIEKITSDKEIIERNTGTTKQKTNSSGKMKGKYQDWIKRNSMVGNAYEDPTGDSILFISPYGDSTLYVPFTGSSRKKILLKRKK